MSLASWMFRRSADLPSAHDIAVATEDFGEATDHDIRRRKNVDIDEIPNGFVNHHEEVESLS